MLLLFLLLHICIPSTSIYTMETIQQTTLSLSSFIFTQDLPDQEKILKEIQSIPSWEMHPNALFESVLRLTADKKRNCSTIVTLTDKNMKKVQSTLKVIWQQVNKTTKESAIQSLPGITAITCNDRSFDTSLVLHNQLPVQTREYEKIYVECLDTIKPGASFEDLEHDSENIIKNHQEQMKKVLDARKRVNALYGLIRLAQLQEGI